MRPGVFVWFPADKSQPYCAPGGPFLFSFIQSTYWSNGLFRYWKVSNLPNFALAAPAIVACSLASLPVLTAVANGLVASSPRAWPAMLARAAPSSFVPRDAGHGHAVLKKRDRLSHGVLSPVAEMGGAMSSRTLALLPFAAHCFALTLLCLLVMNVQVATRFLSACPILYWAVADAFEPGAKTSSRWLLSEGYVLWSALYMALGTILFPLFLPWT